MALRKYRLARVRAIAHDRAYLSCALWSADARAASYASGGAGHASARASPLTPGASL